jgi:hypothetical protein
VYCLRLNARFSIIDFVVFCGWLQILYDWLNGRGRLHGFLGTIAWFAVADWISIVNCMIFKGLLHGFLWLAAWISMADCTVVYGRLLGFLWPTAWIPVADFKVFYGQWFYGSMAGRFSMVYGSMVLWLAARFSAWISTYCMADCLVFYGRLHRILWPTA